MAGVDTENRDEEILEIIRETEAPVVTAKEVAEEIGMTRQGANYRLQELQRKGKVDRKRIGSRAVAWWLTEKSTPA